MPRHIVVAKPVVSRNRTVGIFTASLNDSNNMRLSWLLSLPTLLSVVSALAIEKRDADFLSVRTQLHKDMSGKGGDPKTKYFRESAFPIQAVFPQKMPTNCSQMRACTYLP